MLVEVFKTCEAGLEWLVPSLFRRAAKAYEESGQMREAADCWVAAQEASRAAGLYLREGDYARAAQLLFEAGRYADALESYRNWAGFQSPESEDFVVARLGEAACLTLLRADRSAARAAYRSARAQIEACDAMLQRDTNAAVRRTRSLIAARLWEAMGAYGLHVGREDLLQLGYERALVLYGDEHKPERVRVARAYLAAAGENRLLAQELEAWLAEWEQKAVAREDTRPVALIHVGRTFRAGDRVSIEPGGVAFQPQDTGYDGEIFGHGGETGTVTGSAGATALKVRWDPQKFTNLRDPPKDISEDGFVSALAVDRWIVMLESFESVIAANLLRIMQAPLTKFRIHQSVWERDESKRELERRDWVLASPTTWEQRYPDGKATEFEVSGRAVILGDHGTIVVKRSESADEIDPDRRDTMVSYPTAIEIFIPDRGSRKQWLRMRGKRETRGEQWAYEDWRNVAEMRIIDDDDAVAANERAEIIDEEWRDEILCPRCFGQLTGQPKSCRNCGYGHADPEALLGVTLDGKYKLVEIIAYSGWITVYRAIEQDGSGRECAIKTLKESYIPDGSERRRFFQLAETGLKLQHPNIVSLYDFNMAKLPAPYLVMEMVEGELLLQWMRRGAFAGLGWRSALRLFLEICYAVGAAHRRQIVHRRITPRDVFILPPVRSAERHAEFKNRVKVTNFGYHENPEMPDTWFGNPGENWVAYMSPEQCRDESLTPRSDVYSLGVLLYEMIAGTPPFVAESAVAIARMHLEEAPPPFHPSLEVEPWLETLVMKALAKDPRERPADANALAAELQQFFASFTELQGQSESPGGS
jgi:hypothetical protein